DPVEARVGVVGQRADRSAEGAAREADPPDVGGGPSTARGQREDDRGGHERGSNDEQGASSPRTREQAGHWNPPILGCARPHAPGRFSTESHTYGRNVYTMPP